MAAPTTTDRPALYRYRVLNTYPHDRSAFTQGLVYDEGFLYEGTGLYGQSTLRMVELETGKTVRLRQLPGRFFGEGIAVLGDRIIQATWRSQVVFVYDKRSFELLAVAAYPRESWGLTHDGASLIMSDGSAILRFLDPHTFAERRRLEISDDAGPVTRLNELEYVRGAIYANIWQTDRIAVISPYNGRVYAWIDLAGLLRPEDGPVDALNGIAYDAAGDRLFVTGKLWPKLFQIELVPARR